MKEIEFKNGQVPGCYAGKILRINLTDSTTEIIPTSRYLPKYMGGRTMANKIFWDEVKEAVPALDPRNKLIYMTGPCSGVGLPYGGRAVMTGICAYELPEQYCHSICGGFFGPMLKWAGYDGFILEGKAPKHTYVYIKDDKVEFLDADWLWGKYIQETQEMIFDKYDRETYSLVIGPAGENLHRCATIETGGDSAFAKGGFGAVWGSKNLKAIAVKGTGTLVPGNINKIFEIRKWPDNPATGVPHPIVRNKAGMSAGQWGMYWPERLTGRISCNQGCGRSCMNCQFDVDDPLNPGEKISMVNKCNDPSSYGFTFDGPYSIGHSVHSRRQESLGSHRHAVVPEIVDSDDPHIPIVTRVVDGDSLHMGKRNYELGQMKIWVANLYGLDKWAMHLWYPVWLGALKNEGLLDDLDFGMEFDLENPEFMKHLADIMTYRKNELGNILAEGPARAIRALGKEKYGDTIYKSRYSGYSGERLDIPVGFEAAWGEASHWQGRGVQGCDKWMWLMLSLLTMIDSRDVAGGAHPHIWVDDYLKFKDDPCHSQYFIEKTLENNRWNEMKDTLISCEWKDPQPCRGTLEAEMYNAATGENVTMDEINNTAETGRLLERAIFIRTFGRTRDMEVEEVYPFLTYPDPYGDTVTWDEWNDCVDLYYDAYGWDRKTGWPFRETYEKYGLTDIADELERAGKLPTEDNSRTYIRKANPFSR